MASGHMTVGRVKRKRSFGDRCTRGATLTATIGMANLFPSMTPLLDQCGAGVAVSVLLVGFLRAKRQIFVIVFADIARAVIQAFRFDIVVGW